MKEFSQETINIGGKDYTLFLNRKGIVAWEAITRADREKDDLTDEAEKLKVAQEIIIKDGDNPFEISNAEEILSTEEKTYSYYQKLYWIMLYTNHKLDLKDAEKLFNKALEEYGLEQLVNLALQMLEDANTDRYGQSELKKLTALRPKKN